MDCTIGECKTADCHSSRRTVKINRNSKTLIEDLISIPIPSGLLTSERKHSQHSKIIASASIAE